MLNPSPKQPEEALKPTQKHHPTAKASPPRSPMLGPPDLSFGLRMRKSRSGTPRSSKRWGFKSAWQHDDTTARREQESWWSYTDQSEKGIPVNLQPQILKIMACAVEYLHRGGTITCMRGTSGHVTQEIDSSNEECMPIQTRVSLFWLILKEFTLHHVYDNF